MTFLRTSRPVLILVIKNLKLFNLVIKFKINQIKTVFFSSNHSFHLPIKRLMIILPLHG